MKLTEKIGSFYLGRIIDPSNKDASDGAPLLYDAKNLTTHAVCVGMTGSGKTGLGITVLEEAALDKIPSLIIDPKGDLTDLLLTFPNLSPGEFLPWIDEQEAARKEMQPEAYAEAVAKTWKDGLEKWGEGPERIQALRKAVEMVIYTPASNAGVPLSVLSSFAAPSKELMEDAEALRDRIMSTTSGVLGLLGINADPIKSREHILISTILARAWEKGEDLDIAALIQQVQKPSFAKIGALDMDTFFPPKERLELSITLNNLLASPGFQAWVEGEPLDIQKLLYTSEGKPKLSILSIAHLSTAERMFFVTIFLNELVSWMRRQPGTSSLRALLYMDEVFGFFPPTAMPPSKIPMLTLLKQARAYGLGVMLATQNPVDLDYKGLSNCGTWFIGKLQTERDRARVLEGLQIASNGEIDSKTLDRMLAATKTRVFIMRSIHEEAPILFETRWTMSYLRGPLTLAQISKLTDKSSAPAVKRETKVNGSGVVAGEKPAGPAGIQEFFGRRPNAAQPIKYRPLVLGVGRLHYVDAKNKVDFWQDVCVAAPFDEDAGDVLWDESNVVEDPKSQLDKVPLAGSTFEEPPAGILKEKNYDAFQKSFATFLYQSQTLTLYQVPDLNLVSEAGQTQAEFLSRVSLSLREKRDEAVKKLQDKYAPKKAQLAEKIRRAQEKLNTKQQKAFWAKADTAISFLTALVGAFLGRGVTKGTISNAGTTMRRAGRIGEGSQAAEQAEEDFKVATQQLEDMQSQLNDEIAQLTNNLDPNAVKMDSLVLHPRKSDIAIDKVALLWFPR